MKFDKNKFMSSGNGVLILGIIWFLFWIGPAFSLFQEDSRWGHNFAIPILFIIVGLAYNVNKISCQVTAAIASYLTIPILLAFWPWDTSTIIAGIFLGIFCLFYIIERNRKTELFNPNKRLKRWLKMHSLNFAYIGLVHMTLIFFFVRWNNFESFETYLPYEQEDFDTIIFNAMLPVLTVFAIMERYVKKMGRFPVPKAGFLWSILMVIVPLLVIGILG